MKLKDPSTGAIGSACPAQRLIPLLGLPAAVAGTTTCFLEKLQLMAVPNLVFSSLL